MSILSVDQIQPIGSGTTITLNATEVKTGTEITVGTGASIFSPAGNTLTFGTNNVERFRITNAGAFGLSGTNYGSSGQVLTSQGSGSAPVWSSVSGTTINNNANYRIISGDANANELNAESNLTFNGSTLALTGSQTITGDLDIAEDIRHIGNTNTRIRFGTDTIIARTAGSERLRITSAGKVGIGTADPVGTLEILDTSEYQLVLKDSNNAGPGAEMAIGFKDSDNVYQGIIGFNHWGDDEFHIINQNNGGEITFKTNNGGSQGERLRIQSAGTLKGTHPFIFGGFGSVASNQGCRITGQTGSHPACLSLDGGSSPTLEIGSKSGETIIGTNSYGSAPMNFKTGMGIGTLAGGTTRMSISSAGYVTKPSQVGFEASYPDGYNTSQSPSNYITNWLRVHHNYGSHFNNTNGRFTAPVDGRYLIGAIMTNVSHSNPHVAFGINGGAASGPSRGGTNYTELWHTNAGSGGGLSPVHIFDLSANDYVNVWIYGYTGTPDDPRCYFFGYLLG